MSIFGKFLPKYISRGINLSPGPSCSVCVRFLSHSPMYYNEDPDPAPVFIKPEVQSLLKTLTRADVAKVYKKRKLGEKRLEQPVYKFMTEEQLQAVLDEAKKKVDYFLQIPPIVSVRKPRNKIIMKDPALQGLDSADFVFTDITYGVRDSERLIVVRDTEGTLKEADWDLRDRVNQMYFPVKNREVILPKMFQDENLQDLLKRQEYVFILDRACLQFEPNDPFYQKVVSITYQEVNENNKFDVLRSTRHFGSFVFFLVWNKMLDNLLLDLIETDHIEEGKALIELYEHLHKVKVASIEDYIKNCATKKGALELALQAQKNAERERKELESGIRKAHGN